MSDDLLRPLIGSCLHSLIRFRPADEVDARRIRLMIDASPKSYSTDERDVSTYEMQSA